MSAGARRGPGIPVSMIRNPAETDPLMNRGMRTDFAEPVGRQVVDGGVREGYPEMSNWPGLVWVAALVILLVLGMSILMYFAVFGGP